MFCFSESCDELETSDGVDADESGVATLVCSSSSELGCDARYALFTSELLLGAPNSSVVYWSEERKEVGGGRYLRTRSKEGPGTDDERPSIYRLCRSDDLCDNGTSEAESQNLPEL